MALQPRMIACGKRVATFAMAVRFLTGPAVIAATSIAIGLRGVLLHVAIVQVLFLFFFFQFFILLNSKLKLIPNLLNSTPRIINLLFIYLFILYYYYYYYCRLLFLKVLCLLCSLRSIMFIQIF